MKNPLLASFSFILSAIPTSTLEFIYTTILKPKPLRVITDFILSFLIKEKAEILEGLVALNKKDPAISGAITLGVYEKNESRFFREKVKEGMVVIDIGANVGYYTVMFAKLVGPFGRVISFEPGPENFYFLKKTIKINKFNNVEPYDFALSNKTGRGKLFLCESNKGDHRIYNPDNTRESIDISITTLDNFLAEKKVENVDLIKMDIQGAEGMALNGMKDTLTQNKKISLIIEFWPQGLLKSGTEPISLLNEIRGLGFKIFKIRENPIKPYFISDFDLLIKEHPGRKYANLYCEK